MYDRGKQRKRVNWFVVLIIVYELTLVLVLFFIEVNSPYAVSQKWGTVRMCGYIKTAVTFFKYAPQAYLNYKRKSTQGYSITFVYLDFLGAITSLLQIIFQTLVQGKPLFGNSDDVGFNIVKFVLSMLTIVFDIIFLV